MEEEIGYKKWQWKVEIKWNETDEERAQRRRRKKEEKKEKFLKMLGSTFSLVVVVFPVRFQFRFGFNFLLSVFLLRDYCLYFMIYDWGGGGLVWFWHWFFIQSYQHDFPCFWDGWITLISRHNSVNYLKKGKRKCQRRCPKESEVNAKIIITKSERGATHEYNFTRKSRGEGQCTA